MVLDIRAPNNQSPEHRTTAHSPSPSGLDEWPMYIRRRNEIKTSFAWPCFAQASCASIRFHRIHEIKDKRHNDKEEKGKRTSRSS